MEKYMNFYSTSFNAPVVKDTIDNECCKWGFADYFNDVEEIIKEALTSGKDFDTGYMYATRESYTSRIVKEGATITVFASSAMDEDMDLLDDILFDIYGLSAPAEIISDEKYLEELGRNLDGIETYITYTETLPATSTYSEIVNTIEKCGDKCNEELGAEFEKAKSIIRECIKNRN